MQLTKKQVEFWTAMLVLVLITAIAVMLVDFSIKAAILEESTRLREVIEGEEVRRSGRLTESPNADRGTNDSDNVTPISPDVLVDDSARMEAGNVSNGVAEPDQNGTQTRRPKSRRPVANRDVPSGDK